MKKEEKDKKIELEEKTEIEVLDFGEEEALNDKTMIPEVKEENEVDKDITEKKAKKKSKSKKKEDKVEVSEEEVEHQEEIEIEEFIEGGKKKKRKKKKRMKTWKKVLIILASLFALGVGTVAFLLYGPYGGFRNWLITTAMTTMNHQYLATWFYSDETIQKVLANNQVIESGEDTNPDLIVIEKPDHNQTVYESKWEEQILKKDPGNELYKRIDIREGSLRGYLIVIYDPSKVKIATAKNMGSSGEMLVSIAQRNNAVIAMNASGFDDPDWNSNGGLPHGTVIKDGKIIWTYSRAAMGGGIIGFTNDNKLVLGRMSAQEALNQGIRDAVDFGPFLIVNGKPSFIKGNGGWGQANRSAIAQRKDGIVMFLVMDGRDYIAGVPGADMVDLTEILMRYGAYNAANLDGGTSSGLVVNNELINKPVNGMGQTATRPIPNAWIVTE